MTTPSGIHDPQARLDYEWVWSSWLDSGETINSHTVTVLPPDEMMVESSTHTGSTVTAWVSGGNVGRTYVLTCHITTSANRQDDRSFVLTCKDR